MSAMAPQCSQDYFLALRLPQPQPPSTAQSPDWCSPRLQHWACAPCHGLSPHPNLSLHALRCRISSTVWTPEGTSHFCVCARAHAHACDLTRLWVPSGLRLQSFGFSARIYRFSGTVCWSGVEVCSLSPRGQSGVGLQSAPQPRCAQALLQQCPPGLGWVCSGRPEALPPPQAWSFPLRPGVSFGDADRRAELLPLSLEAINAKLSLSQHPSGPPPPLPPFPPLPSPSTFLPSSPSPPSPSSCKHLSYLQDQVKVTP